MRAVWVPLMGAFAVALTTIALLPANTEAQQSVTIVLSPQNDSGQTGTAVLTSEGAGTKVVVNLSSAPGPHPAHIHAGSCPTPGAVVFPLTSVTNGRSETVVAASIADILRAPHAINVHKSPQEIPVYTSCGNVTAAAAPTAQASPAAKPAAAPAAAAPAAQASPAAKPAAPSQAPAQAPAAKPAAAASPAAKPAAAPAQAPKPAASPAALPRTGEVDPNAGLLPVAAGGVALVGVGLALLAWRRRSA